MNKKSSKITKATALILLGFVIVLSSLQTPEVTADINVTINPTSGKVGTIIEINATIETENGFYTVRWNTTLNVTTGYADGYNVETSFTVPQTDGTPQGRDVPVELIDNTTKKTGTALFKLYTGHHVKAVAPSPPLQLQEGANTTIWVNITGGEPSTIYAANITVKDPVDNTYICLTELITNATGYGQKCITYPANFSVAAHTNYTGKYTVAAAVAFNETLATSEFSIGLTNATEYTLLQTVNMRAANYTYLGEHTWVNITYNGGTIFSENVTALNGIIETDWTIPINATIGNYTVTIINSTTPGTRKPVDDTQQLIVKKPVFTVQIKTENLNSELLSYILVEAYNKTAKVEAKSTNATGIATLLLEMANYTFKALFKEVEVGVLYNRSIIENKALTLTCNLTNIKILVTDETSDPMPFISLTANYSYTTRLNTSTQETRAFTTNYTGTWKLPNMFTNISYFIEARRYDHIFNQTYIEKMPIAPLFNIVITLPTYNALIHVVDSQNNAAESVKVEAYEWSKGTDQPEQSYTTNSDGNVTFSLTFGKYKLRAYKDDAFLDETTLDLIQNQSHFIFHLTTFNVGLTVTVLDYFGQPIPNAVVKVERKATAKSVENTTGHDGRVTFDISLGGDSRILIYIWEQLSGTKDLYLTNSKQVTFSLNKYVVIAGYTLETSQFVTAIALAILVIVFIVALTYKRLLRIFIRGK